MSDIYRHSVTRHPRYNAHVGHRMPASLKYGKRGRASSLAAGILTFLLFIAGAGLLTVFAVRCAAEDAANQPRERGPGQER